jgi:beta-glucosidase
VEYSEGLEVGYRWYDAQNVKPLFPFGFGLSYARFSYTNLRVGRGASNGVRDIQVTAKVTNTGKRAGADVAQLYLGDPRAAGEPPRQLVGFQRVSLDPGQSTRVQFTITPRDTWWWDQDANGWNQSTGRYAVYVGDSSAPSDLPLRDAFDINGTPGARQVVVSAPRTMDPGKTSKVRVKLTKGGEETLQDVQIALQLPQGWTAQPLAQASFRHLAPGQAATVKFAVTPPSWAPSTNSVVHATADLGPDAQREDGVTVRVG